MPAPAVSLRQIVDRSHGVDAVVVAGLGALAIIEIVFTRGQFTVRGHLIQGLCIAVAMCAGLGWRRRRPLLTSAVALSGVSAAAVVGVAPQAWLVPYLCVVAYSVGAFARGWESGVGLAVSVITGWVVASSAVDGSVATDYVWAVAMLGASWAAGFGLRRRNETAVLDRHEALAEQRARIARELHDVVAHSLTVIVVTSDAAEMGLQRDPQLAAAPLQTIRRVAQDALGEMRRLVGILRIADGESNEPQPSLNILGELADTMRASGVPVTVTVDGDLSDLPPGPDLAAYRIVQEALTNIRRHAPQGSRAWITVRKSASALEIEVVNDGAADAQPAAAGHGLVGMSERVALYEGRFEAAALPTGGFRVAASLPLRVRT
jgi:signal transduction histidine kinase